MVLAIILGTMPVDVLADTATNTSVHGQLDQDIDDLLNQKGFSGTLLVVKNGKTVYRTSQGYSDFANGLSNEKNTTYEIDSVQKSLTAAMIMKQVQKGKLSLTENLSDFYPTVPGSDRITIRQMLDMTSGLSMSQVGPPEILPDSGIIQEDIKNIHFSELTYKKWDYQPVNYNLLCGVLEQLTGKSYQKLFTETYIKKLHLKHTIFAYDEKPNIDKATGYNNNDPLSSRLDYRNAFVTKRFFEFDELGTGQVYMSANDLYKVEKYIMRGKMLTKKSRKTLFKPGSISTYGGGMYHGKDDNFANGWGYGFQVVVHMSNNGKNAVILLENYSRIAADAKPIAKQVYQMIQDEHN